MLLRSGSVIQIRHEASAREVRLRKVTLPRDEDGIRLEVPQVPANEAYEGAVQAAIHEHLPWTRESTLGAPAALLAVAAEA